MSAALQRSLAVLSLFAACLFLPCMAAETTGHTDHLGVRPPAFPLKITAELHAPLKAGAPVPVTLKLTYADGIPVLPSALLVAHTKLMHLLVIDPTLTDYQHIHPAPAASGEWNFTFTPKKNGPYRIWADITLKRGGHHYLKVDIGTPPAVPPVIDRTASDTATVDEYTFALSFDSPPEAGKAAMGTIRITDHSGQPVTSLQPVMGAFAHIVAFSADGSSVLHIHPMGPEPGWNYPLGGPELQFHMEPAAPGFVKLFVQVDINGHDLFAPFGVMVQ